MADQNINFENSLLELENIVSILEKGECSLDESIKLFENGMKHISICKDALKKAENKINSITQQKEGENIND